MNDAPLDPAIRQYIEANGLDTVEGAFAFAGGEELSKPGLVRRRRTRLTIPCADGGGAVLYLKRYERLSPGARLWRFLTGRRNRCEAITEFENIRALRLGGLPTMREIVCGREKTPLGGGRNYLIVSAVPGDALERIGDDFFSRTNGTNRHADPAGEDELTETLIALVRGLHRLGFVHRDLYASHVFLHETDNGAELRLIDLARAFRPRIRKRRWRVKDLAQLKYSMPWLWVKNCWRTFLMGYLDSDNEADMRRWDALVSAKVEEMTRRTERRRKRKERHRETA